MNVEKSTALPRVYYMEDLEAPGAKAELAICPRIYTSAKGELRIEWRNMSTRGMDFRIVKVAGVELNKEYAEEICPIDFKVVLENNKELALHLITTDVWEKRIQVFKKTHFDSNQALEAYLKEYDPEFEAYNY